MAQQIVSSFDEIADEFHARIARIVWCTMATTDPKRRTRVRLVHPVFEGSTGWITTRRYSNKGRHLAANPHVSLGYWDPQQAMVYVDARAEWMDDAAEKQRVWDYIAAVPPPLGFDPAFIWAAGPSDPGFGLLKLTPWRIEICGMHDGAMAEPRIWRP